MTDPKPTEAEMLAAAARVFRAVHAEFDGDKWWVDLLDDTGLADVVLTKYGGYATCDLTPLGQALLAHAEVKDG